MMKDKRRLDNSQTGQAGRLYTQKMCSRFCLCVPAFSLHVVTELSHYSALHICAAAAAVVERTNRIGSQQIFK